MKENNTEYEDWYQDDKSVWQKVYYSLERFFVWIVWEPIRPGTLKHYYQRIRRGYSDRDACNLNYWLVQTLTPAIENIKRYRYGASAFSSEKNEFNEALDEIIYGLRCARHLVENDYWLTDDEEGREENMRKSAERSFVLIARHLSKLWYCYD